MLKNHWNTGMQMQPPQPFHQRIKVPRREEDPLLEQQLTPTQVSRFSFQHSRSAHPSFPWPSVSANHLWPCYACSGLVFVCLLLSYFLFDVRINIGFYHPPLACNASMVRWLGNATNGPALATMFDVNNDTMGSGAEVFAWRGYVDYLKHLEAYRPGPLESSQSLSVAGWGPYGFARFSAYRMREDAIAVVGFGARMLRDSATRSVSKCWWEETEGESNSSSTDLAERAMKTIPGTVQMLYSEEHGDLTYDTIIIQCHLNEPTGTLGGVAKATIDSSDVVLYREDFGKTHTIVPPPDEFLDHFITVCAPNLRDPVEPRALVEFIEYHRRMGANHFVLYDGGALDENVATALDEFLKNGIVEVVPFREVKKYEILEEGHLLAAHDCVYRSRLTSKWVFVLNWDAYIFVPPPSTLMTLLDAYHGRPWLTFGTLTWATQICRPGPPVFGGHRWTPQGVRLPFVIERMVFHWPHIVCHGPPSGVDPKVCLDHNGERSFVCDPRQINTVHWHEVGNPREGGEHLNFEEAHQQRFSELHFQAKFGLACSDVRRDEEPIDWWVRDLEQARYSRVTRQSPIPV
eukprot:TRINITY_DN8170_c0_g2_i1.p1 TRINITY_DN8170_c0_g2~~TRINITY_DN8170_c0_g2_i1.p1  ORF type:complete len:575 (+),score=80.12 TRINITY_DN8170_c0_g2_i1:1226-2950(+)